MSRKKRTCFCEICLKNFIATSDARACPGECRTTLFRLIGKGEAPKTDKPTGSLQSAALQREQDEAKRKNLYLTSKITVSQETINKTNLQAMVKAA